MARVFSRSGDDRPFTFLIIPGRQINYGLPELAGNEPLGVRKDRVYNAAIGKREFTQGDRGRLRGSLARENLGA
jgi:hypothetical protein